VTTPRSAKGWRKKQKRKKNRGREGERERERESVLMTLGDGGK